MSIPDVTMIIPTRHRARLLEATLLSLLTARAEARRAGACEVRLLVVDDAPEDDDTFELVASIPGVDYLRVTEHDGRADPGAAIALGVQHVDTQFQSLFGDDDIVLPRHFVAAAPLMADHDVVSSSFLVVDGSLREKNRVTLRETGLRDLLRGRVALNDGSFVRHDLVRDLEWDVSLEAHMLVPIWARLMADQRRFAVVEEPTWLYRRHETNISHTAYDPRDMALRARARELVNDLVASRPDLLRQLYPPTRTP